MRFALADGATADECPDRVRGKRPGHVVSLRQVAVEFLEPIELWFGLHPLGYHFHSQCVRQSNRNPDDDRILLILIDSLNEGLVDLEDVDGEPLQVRQRGVASAEVVDGEFDAESVSRMRG